MSMGVGIGRREITGMVVGAVVLALLPMVVQDSYYRHLLIMVFIYGIVASSWDLSLGYAGIFNFGHMALFGIGLYTYGLATTLLGISPWIALLAGGVLAALAAALISLPILRLKGIYVVLVTFAFGQLVVQLIISQSDYTGGNQGLVRIPSFHIPGHNLMRDHKLGFYYIALILLCCSTVFLRLMVRSRLGLAIRALRDNEEYATSRGISISRQRLITMAGSAVFTGLAGAFYGAYFRNASTDVFGASLTTLLLSMVLLGGISTIYGSLLAALLLTIFSEMIAGLGAWRPIVIGVLIILVMLAYPGGLYGAIAAAARALRRLGRRQASP
ncbi:branched-chain amino acid ABC transporter permease [Acidisoma cellulosilytica]|uniref:Branched-chain amino acid ABC transporter permease n=1 Tax=Acidisoma cellulosilyticum TaxID=2802395 RepID=A0A963Z216_9PROT|nr:branched-chain amino acid ABC transporter permease [Acidisoma cellulosilyticum]MCB8881335.1 branched-chain amino acid ABC transporter permease [Acidisoma cellulosilyticum]